MKKTAIITGSSKGIGAATAKRFAKEGYSIVVNYKTDLEAATGLVQELQNGSIAVQADVTTEQGAQTLIKQTLDTFGTIDVVVNNAGGSIAEGWNGPVEAWSKTFELNVISTMIISKYAIEQFKKQQSGIIVNLASRFGYMADPDMVAYSAAKAAVVSLTRGYATQLAPYGRANCVAPGATVAGGWLNVSQEERDQVAQGIPLKKLSEAEDIANAIYFLASEEARMITGQTLIVDGGYLLTP